MLKVVFELVGYGGDFGGGDFGVVPDLEKLYDAKEELSLLMKESEIPFSITVQERFGSCNFWVAPALRIHCDMKDASECQEFIEFFLRTNPGVLMNIQIKHDSKILTSFDGLKFASKQRKDDCWALQRKAVVENTIPMDPEKREDILSWFRQNKPDDLVWNW